MGQVRRDDAEIPESCETAARVRGGGGLIQSVWTPFARLESFAFSARTKMLPLVDDDEAKVGKPDVVRSERLRCRPRPSVARDADSFVSLVADPIRLATGSPRQCRADRTAAECRDVLLRQTVVGTRDGNMVTCERTAAAARKRTSVLPKPTSPQTTRFHGMTGREIVPGVLNRARLIRSSWKYGTARDETSHRRTPRSG